VLFRSKIDKAKLKVDQTYQRDSIHSKILELASNWSWIACGVLIVAERDGGLWVIDGQHRLMAAMRRSDISKLPCIVFSTVSIKEEAKGFLSSNGNRKPVGAIGKFKAMNVAGDASAIYVSQKLDSLGLRVLNVPKNPKEIKSIAWAVKRASEDRERFDRVIEIAEELSTSKPIMSFILEGLWYIDAKVEGGLSNKRLREKILKVGDERLLLGISRAKAYYSRGGEKVFASGMLDEINKNLRTKFELSA
jgi:hypothetical protein